MNDSGMDKRVWVLWNHNNDRVVHAPVHYVAGAVTVSIMLQVHLQIRMKLAVLMLLLKMML